MPSVPLLSHWYGSISASRRDGQILWHPKRFNHSHEHAKRAHRCTDRLIICVATCSVLCQLSICRLACFPRLWEFLNMMLRVVCLIVSHSERLRCCKSRSVVLQYIFKGSMLGSHARGIPLKGLGLSHSRIEFPEVSSACVLGT